MLVLTRKLDEQITIGDHQIQLKVLGVKGGRVRIGIEAPQHIRIERLDVSAEELLAIGDEKPARP